MARDKARERKSIFKRFKAMVFLGMNPWTHTAINDSVRFLTRAASEGDPKPRGACFYLNPPLGLKNSLARLARSSGAGVSRLRPLKTAFSWQEENDQGVRIFTPPLGFMPVAFGLRKKAEAWLARRFAQKMEQAYGANWREQVLIYVSSWSYTQANFIRQLAPRHLLFHLLDDTLAFPMVQNAPRVLRENQAFLKALMAQSNLVLAVSEELAEKYGRLFNREILVLKNGVEVDRFRTAVAKSFVENAEESPFTRAGREPGLKTGLKPDQNSVGPKSILNPVLMYVGSINSWVDLDLLRTVAEQKPAYTLVLIGHCYPETIVQADWDALLRLPNVFWLQSKPYAEIPGYMRAASVLLLPRTGAEHSRASDPLKLYEYLATGKPVVSTALPAVEDFRDLVYVAQTGPDFMEQLESALVQHDGKAATAQQAAVENHSWPARIQEMAALWDAHAK